MKINSKVLTTKDDLQKFKPFMNLDSLPKDLRISTITITCFLDTIFYVENIGRYIDLNYDGIISRSYGNIFKSIAPQKKTKKRKKKKKTFYNQATVKIKTEYKVKPINVKLFKNGSIQMTGCKSINDCISGLQTLCRELKKMKAIVDPNTMNKIILKPFISNIENISIDKVKNIKIRMINSNFNIGFKVNRSSLYEVLLNQNIDCIFEPCVHACVNIKYVFKNLETISIFVFESGSIIITGAKNREHIIKAYEFITNKLFENYQVIIKNDLQSILEKLNLQE